MVLVQYNRDIPDGPDNPSQDQPDMKINTNSIDDIISVDHYSFNNNNSGWHKQSTYPLLGVAPTTSTTQGAVYTKDIGGGIVQLFYRRENNGAEVQITSATGLLNVPTILTGTFNNNSNSFQNIVLLPANIYGYIIFFNSGTPVVQMGQFFTNAITAFGFSNRLVANGSSDDDPVELQNTSSSGLNLRGRRDDFGTVNVSWRLHYWSV